MRTTHTADAPEIEPAPIQETTSIAEIEEAEALFREAKQRERRRRLFVVTAVLAVAGLAAGLIASFGGSPPLRSGNGTGSGDGGTPSGGIVGQFNFRGNGIGTAQFGQAESVAIANLVRVLGTPTTPRPTNYAGNCTVDAYLTWPTMTAYFYRRSFVGYNSATLFPGTGKKQVIPDATTAAGMRIGDTLPHAVHIYGKSLTVSYAQGGSWFAKTSTGTLDGYLTAVPGHPTPPVPKIADISAGSVGCPAASP